MLAPAPPANGDRGRTAAHADDADLRYAMQAIAKGQADLAAWRVSAAMLGAIEKRNARDAALAQIAHGLRFASTVLERHGFAI